MCKKLCFLTVLMAMIAISANVALAGHVTESFGDNGTVDQKGPANETPQTQTVSGLTWGGYNPYKTTDTRTNVVVEVKNTESVLGFNGRLVNNTFGAYAYTMFSSHNMANGALIEFMATEKLDADFEFLMLIKAGGVWYVSDSPKVLNDDVAKDMKAYSFDPAADTTWEAVDANTVAMLDDLTTGAIDEAAIVGSGVTGTVLGDTELGDVTGSGFIMNTDPGSNNGPEIDDIVWKQDPTINNEAVVTLRGDPTDVMYGHIVTVNPGDTYPGTNFDPDKQGDGWQAINNAAATDEDGDPLTYLWEVTDYVGTDAPSEQEAIDDVLFQRLGGTDGVDENALDPNIIYPYLGTYTLTLTAIDGRDDGEPDGFATLTQHVVTNRAPRVVSFGTLNRTKYDGATIQTLNPSIRDDDYPLDVAKTTQIFKVLEGPAPLPFFYNGDSTGWTGVTTYDAYDGRGKGHPILDVSPEDPNVTFP
ncbi:MAG: hypothetical protein KAR47_14355, partial [Planctomycetes bacterium]|nr:hypothetical protein [Planctomycetota bacterium]